MLQNNAKKKLKQTSCCHIYHEIQFRATNKQTKKNSTVHALLSVVVTHPPLNQIRFKNLLRLREKRIVVGQCRIDTTIHTIYSCLFWDSKLGPLVGQASTINHHTNQNRFLSSTVVIL